MIASEFRCTEYNNEYYLAPKAYNITINQEDYAVALKFKEKECYKIN